MKSPVSFPILNSKTYNRADLFVVSGLQTDQLKAFLHVKSTHSVESSQLGGHMIHTLLKKGHYQPCENKRPSQSRQQPAQLGALYLLPM